MVRTVEIPLSRGHVALIDVADFAIVSRYKWHAAAGGTKSRFYACACLGKKQAAEIGRRHIRMHRLIMGFPDHDIDHENNNQLDNRRINLRLATPAQNQQNRLKGRRGLSRYKGVSYHRKSAKWQVSICHGGSSKYVGSYDDELTAAKAYDRKALDLFGQFACINIPK